MPINLNQTSDLSLQMTSYVFVLTEHIYYCDFNSLFLSVWLSSALQMPALQSSALLIRKSVFLILGVVAFIM